MNCVTYNFDMHQYILAWSSELGTREEQQDSYYTINIAEEVKSALRQLRVAAYCRVSTKQEEQLNSYEVQRNYQTMATSTKTK